MEVKLVLKEIQRLCGAVKILLLHMDNILSEVVELYFFGTNDHIIISVVNYFRLCCWRAKGQTTPG